MCSVYVCLWVYGCVVVVVCLCCAHMAHAPAYLCWVIWCVTSLPYHRCCSGRGVVSLVQQFEDVFATALGNHRRATAAVQHTPESAASSSAVARFLNHQKRVWGLVNALWGQVRAPFRTASVKHPPTSVLRRGVRLSVVGFVTSQWWCCRWRVSQERNKSTQAAQDNADREWTPEATSLLTKEAVSRWLQVNGQMMPIFRRFGEHVVVVPLVSRCIHAGVVVVCCCRDFLPPPPSP